MLKEKSSSTPVNESPIEWRLLTTHVVETVEQAIECIGWYRYRWLIEELFRVLKRKGFMIEDAQLETVSALQKLIVALSPEDYIVETEHVECSHTGNHCHEPAHKWRELEAS